VFYLTDSKTVLPMMDRRYARAMGLLVLTSERILFRARRSTGPSFSVPLGTSLLSRHTPARCRHCPHHQEHLSLDAEDLVDGQIADQPPTTPGL
jgi:hypothetical protein